MSLPIPPPVSPKASLSPSLSTSLSSSHFLCCPPPSTFSPTRPPSPPSPASPSPRRIPPALTFPPQPFCAHLFPRSPPAPLLPAPAPLIPGEHEGNPGHRRAAPRKRRAARRLPQDRRRRRHPLTAARAPGCQGDGNNLSRNLGKTPLSLPPPPPPQQTPLRFEPVSTPRPQCALRRVRIPRPTGPGVGRGSTHAR